MDKLLIFITSLLILTLAINCRDIDVSKKTKSSFIENKINQTIYKIINSLSDPIEVQNETLTIADGPFAGFASIGNFKITGIRSVEVPVLKLTGFLSYKLHLKLILESVVLSTNYQAGMEIIYGKGDLNVNLSNLSAEITSKVTLIPIKVSNLQIVVNLGDCVVELTGYYYDGQLSKLISNGLTNDSANDINNNQEIITNILSPIVQEMINNFLSGRREFREEFKTLITELAQQNEFVDDE